MSNPPPRTPAECLATIILWLSRTVDSHSMWGKLARPLAVLILDRIRAIKHRFDRLAARIEAGQFTPRRPSATPRARTPRPPRAPNPLPQKFAWMVRLVQETAVYGSQLQNLLQQPEMVALMQAAPAEMRRVLRPLCHMLGVRPPPILAPPPSARPKPPSPAALTEPAKPAARKRPKKPEKPRYVFGLRYPPPFPDPA